MSHITRCPACSTVFRVTREQLDARQGYVRCGQCAKVFDARVSMSVEPSSSPPAETPVAEEPGAVEEIAIEAPVSLTPADLVEAAELSPAALPPADLVEAPEFSPAEEDEELAFGPQRHQANRRAAMLWGIGSGALVVLLGVQAAYFFRSDLATAIPASKPLLEGLCAVFRCTIPPPRHLELLSIEASDLQIEKGVPGLLTLNATLRNRASFEQMHPSIELTLTDADERAIARRIVTPREYLAERLPSEPAFAANSEYAIKLNIDASSLRAAGYRMVLFYP